MKLHVQVLSLVALMSLGASAAHAQIDLSALSGVRKASSIFAGDVRIVPGSTLRFKTDIAAGSGFSLQDGKRVLGDGFDDRKPSVGFSIPTKVFDEKCREWVDGNWSIANGTTFTVDQITVYRTGYDVGSLEIAIETSSGPVSMRITCDAGADNRYRRSMTSDEFSSAVGSVIEIIEPN